MFRLIDKCLQIEKKSKCPAKVILKGPTEKQAKCCKTSKHEKLGEDSKIFQREREKKNHIQRILDDKGAMSSKFEGSYKNILK